jgi:hypothetical protein
MPQTAAGSAEFLERLMALEKAMAQQDGKIVVTSLNGLELPR